MRLPASPHTLLASRRRRALATLMATALLGACAGLKTYYSEVSTYGSWPSERAAGSYAIDRLPSQQAHPDELQPVEQAAEAALQAAGFQPVAAGGTPDVMVQIGARVSQQLRSPWDDPLWWRVGYNRWNWPRWGGPGWGWGMRLDSTEYQREVAVLIRDRASGQPLYEARARSDGMTQGSSTLMTAMFTAALKDFPKAQPEPHNVSVVLP
jgi:hypothetical protein